MAKKKILKSDGSGSMEEIASSSVYYEDTSAVLYATSITASNISSSYTNNSIVIVNNNLINGSLYLNSQSGSIIGFNNNSITSDKPSTVRGDLSGELSGTVKVISVGNVNTGILGIANGGTGLSLNKSGILIKDSNNALNILESPANNSVISLLNGPSGPYWSINEADPTTIYKSRLDVYTTSATWTKIGNPRFITVITIGAGGGGGGAGGNINARAGGGGGGGGYSVVTLEAGNITSATITVGTGGNGGPISTGNGTGGTAGTAGGDTSFSVPGILVSAIGGRGGIASPTSAPTAGNSTSGASGDGNYFYQQQNGGSGALKNQYGVAGNGGFLTAGGGGGGGADTVTANGGSGYSGGPPGPLIAFNFYGSHGIYNISPGSPTNKSILSNTYYLNNSSMPTTFTATPIFGTGGFGGVGGGLGSRGGLNGGDGLYGSGGGGGGMKCGPAPASYWGGQGGRGGDGIVLVYSF